MRLTPEQLIQQLSSAVDPAFARSAVESYVEMQQRFLAGDWQPAELDAGRLCEAVSRAIYQLDSGTTTHSQLPNAIRTKLLDEDGVARPHSLANTDRQNIVKAVDAVYKLRSSRGAIHISPTYTANYMDSMFALHAGKWILAEFLRLAWNQDRDSVAAIIEQLVQLQHSLIHELDGKPLVLAKGISAPDEVLLLLFNAPNNRLNRTEIRTYAANQKPQTVAAAISRLIKEKHVRRGDDDQVVLTPPGQKRVTEQVLPKWAPTK
jgi:hypothetical protein